MPLTNLILPALIAFALQMVLCPLMIPFLHKLKFGQYIRELGPKEHQKKAGTPMMGGIMILGSFLITTLIFFKYLPNLWIIPAMTMALGLVGFLDDFIKVVMKHNEGLKPKQKFALQIFIGALFAFYLYKAGFPTSLNLRLLGTRLELGLFFYPFVVFVVVAVANGTNLTDGLDGLLSSVTAVIALFLALAALGLKSDTQITSSAMLGALLGFLVFNAYPAKVFMGDTGALGIGGFVAATAFVLDMPLLILFFGFIYVAENLSDLIQFAYFRATHGKRFFKMAPIHHHFELSGWHETRVTMIFTIVTVLCCLVSAWIVFK